MADDAKETKEAKEAQAQAQPAVIADAPSGYYEYTFEGSENPDVGDEIFHRSAGPMKKGEKAMLTRGQADELRSAGFKLTDPKK